MRNVKRVSLVLGAVLLVIGIGLFLVGFFNPESAGIKIETNPASLVFIDGTQVGRTPFEETLAPGEFVIKLVPESKDTPLSPYETKLKLVSGIQTAIFRDFGEFEADSSGAIVSFEKESTNASFLSVISTPDSAQVVVDGEIVGFTPFKTDKIAEGEHSVEVIHPGFKGKSVSVKTVKKFNLTVSFSLARDKEQEPPKVEVEEVIQQVKILSTPTGFLRVRSGPSIAEPEIAQVAPDDIYDLVEEDEAGKWYKILVKEGVEGWVSSEYAQKVTP